jgi:hypothetical protein
MSLLTRTQAQLKELGYPFIGVECADGSKLFGHVVKFTQYKIYLEDRNKDTIDVPRRIIKRAFLLLHGGNEDNAPAKILRSNRPATG